MWCRGVAEEKRTVREGLFLRLQAIVVIRGERLGGEALRGAARPFKLPVRAGRID